MSKAKDSNAGKAIEDLRAQVARAVRLNRWDDVLDATAKLKEAMGLALHAAVKAGDLPEVRRLADLGADLNAADRADGRRPAHVATAGGHAAILEFLSSSGAMMLVKDHKGKTPAQLAKEGNQKECARILERSDLRLEKFVDAARRGLVPTLRKFLDAGIHPDTGIDGEPALLAACRNQQMETAKLLIERGADIGLVDKENGMTVLHYLTRFPTDVQFSQSFEAKSRRYAEAALGAVALAVKRASQQDLDARETRGDTPLHEVCNTGLYGESGKAIMLLLLEAGANPMLTNNMGKSPVEYAPKNLQDGVRAVFESHALRTVDVVRDSVVATEEDEDSGIRL